MNHHQHDMAQFLEQIESETGIVPHKVSVLQEGIGDIQIAVYPASGGGEVRTFNLQDGFTASVQKEIRHWFEPFAN